jgi:hypothetical protein
LPNLAQKGAARFYPKFRGKFRGKLLKTVGEKIEFSAEKVLKNHFPKKFRGIFRRK